MTVSSRCNLLEEKAYWFELMTTAHHCPTVLLWGHLQKELSLHEKNLEWHTSTLARSVCHDMHAARQVCATMLTNLLHKN